MKQQRGIPTEITDNLSSIGSFVMMTLGLNSNDFIRSFKLYAILVPFDPNMVRYKIDHQGTSWDETHWMPAGNNTDDFIISHRQNAANVWAVAARYIVHDESTPTPVFKIEKSTGDQRQTPTPLYEDGIANVVLRGPHQSDTSKNLATKVLSAIGSHPLLSGSGYLNNQGVNPD